MGTILPKDGTKRTHKLHTRYCTKINRKLLEENGGVIKMDISHETISKIFSEQLRQLPLGGDDSGQP